VILVRALRRDVLMQRATLLPFPVDGGIRNKWHPQRATSPLSDGDGRHLLLTGKADDPLSKDRATRIAEPVRGARAVDNRMLVAPEQRPDSDVERDVRKALSYNAATAKLPLVASVKNVVVTLISTMGSWQEQQLAKPIADAVRGVR